MTVSLVIKKTRLIPYHQKVVFLPSQDIFIVERLFFSKVQPYGKAAYGYFPDLACSPDISD